MKFCTILLFPKSEELRRIESVCILHHDVAPKMLWGRSSPTSWLYAIKIIISEPEIYLLVFSMSQTLPVLYDFTSYSEESSMSCRSLKFSSFFCIITHFLMGTLDYVIPRKDSCHLNFYSITDTIARSRVKFGYLWCRGVQITCRVVQISKILWITFRDVRWKKTFVIYWGILSCAPCYSHTTGSYSRPLLASYACNKSLLLLCAARSSRPMLRSFCTHVHACGAIIITFGLKRKSYSCHV